MTDPRNCSGDLTGEWRLREPCGVQIGLRLSVSPETGEVIGGTFLAEHRAASSLLLPRQLGEVEVSIDVGRVVHLRGDVVLALPLALPPPPAAGGSGGGVGPVVGGGAEAVGLLSAGSVALRLILRCSEFRESSYHLQG